MASFGTRLKQEREKRRISLEEISQSTKISTRFLHALEDENLDQLPGGIFNKGFIRAYARHLGLDEEEVVADYLAATGLVPVDKKSDAPSQAPVVEMRILPAESETTGVPWGLFAAALLIVSLGFAVWNFYSRERRKPANPAAAVPGKELLSGVAAAGPSTASPEAATELKPALARQSAVPAPAKSAPSAPADSAVPKTPAATTGNLVLRVTAREDSWISITSDGKEVMRGTFVAPGERTIRGNREITVKAGNVGALDFEFGGRKLPAQGDYGEVKTLTFDASGLQPSPPKTDTPTPQP